MRLRDSEGINGSPLLLYNYNYRYDILDTPGFIPPYLRAVMDDIHLNEKSNEYGGLAAVVEYPSSLPSCNVIVKGTVQHNSEISEYTQTLAVFSRGKMANKCPKCPKHVRQIVKFSTTNVQDPVGGTLRQKVTTPYQV